MSSLVITVKSTETQADLQQKFQLDPNEKLKFRAQLANFIKTSEILHQCEVEVQTGSDNPVAASGTLTLSSVVATDAITIGAVTFTGSDTASTVVQFDTSLGTDALIAANLASTINSHPTISQIVTASADAAVVTVTCKVKGVVGNAINISSADGTITASGANLTGGTGGVTETAVSYDFGG